MQFRNGEKKFEMHLCRDILSFLYNINLTNFFKLKLNFFIFVVVVVYSCLFYYDFFSDKSMKKLCQNASGYLPFTPII